jgi:hypothetical protein
MIILRRVNLALAVLAMLAPIAHVLELPNKLALDGPLWLAIRQHLYRGWGPLLGGPIEIGALVTSVGLVVPQYLKGGHIRWLVVASFSYAGMIAAFCIFNAPVNVAVSIWTDATLPGNWPDYRLRWETGHCLSALLSVIAFAALFNPLELNETR